MFIIWKLEWLKIFKLTSKMEVVTALLQCNCFDYFFQVLFINVTVWILLKILTHFSVLNIYLNTTHPETLRYSRLKREAKINWKSHEIFFWKSYWAMQYLVLWIPGLQNIFWKNSPTLLSRYLMCTPLLHL